MRKQLFILVVLISSIFFTNKAMAQNSAYYDETTETIYVKLDPSRLNENVPYVDIKLRKEEPVKFGIKVGFYNGPDYITILPDPSQGEFVPNGTIRLEFIPWKWEQEGKPSTGYVEIISTDGDDRRVHRYTFVIFVE